MEVVKEYTVSEILKDDKVLKDVGKHENGRYNEYKYANYT